MALSLGRPLRRTVVAGLLAGTALVAVAGCGRPELDDARLVATLRTQLDSQGVRAEDLTCPDLPAEVGRSVRCTFTVGGQPVDAVASVSAVDGGTATYEVHTEARPVAREVLERALPQTLAQAGAPAGTAVCAGDLPARVGATVTCTLTGADAASDWVLRTTSVDGGKIDYSIEQMGLT
ncbi:MAG: hypothetical protein QOK35_1473 [Pseudonocardiales bacterium]|nr:hypothetical protein [Pseudonocardiales bacterium]